MYRDDLAATIARRDALGQELARLQSRLVDHESTQARVRALTAELAEVTKQVEQSRRKVSLPMLDQISVSTPCKEPWAKMKGSDQVRHCDRCDKDVYNLSAMTAEAAEALIGNRSNLCVRFFRRPDGTVLTSDCPVGARRRRRRRLVVTAVAVAAGALGVTWILQDRSERLGASPMEIHYPDTSIQGGMSERMGDMAPMPVEHDMGKIDVPRHLAAATVRRDALGQELARLQAQLVDHEATQAKVRALAAELAEVTRRIEEARRKVSLPMLEDVSVSTPCHEPWAKMKGGDQVRHCDRCDKDVYNLSAMSAEDAEALLGSRDEMCVRFFRRPDGTVLTSDCPVGARRRRNRRLVVTAVAVAAGALGVTWMLRDRDLPLGEAKVAAPIAHGERIAPDPEPPPAPAVVTPPVKPHPHNRPHMGVRRVAK